MSALFEVRVLNIVRDVVELRVFIVHPDQTRFCTTATFALMVLWDPVHPVYQIESELGKEISMDDILNEDFVQENSSRFIKSVNIKDLKNYPRDVNFDEMSEDEFDAYWENEEGLPQATLVIQVTDPKWIAHLESGMEWETAAYDL